MTTPNLIDAARRLCETWKGFHTAESLNRWIAEVEFAHCHLPPDAVVVSRALLMESANIIDGTLAASVRVIIKLREAAGEE